MSCHISTECHMDNSNHTIHHVSWTIILNVYNFQLNSYHVDIFMHTYIHMLSHNYHQACYSKSSNNYLILEAKCDIYYVLKKAPRQAINRPPQPAIHMPQSCTKQDLKQSQIHSHSSIEFSLNQSLNPSQTRPLNSPQD